jgi:membrane-bound metal-dependent hydrolase YbcI (DUF457 family)
VASNSTNREAPGLLHSLARWAMAVFLFVALTIWIGWSTWLALCWGYGDHFIAGSLTPSGIKMLYPNHTRSYLLPRGWRITTGSAAEEFCFVLLAMCAIVLMLHSLT